MSQNFWSAKLFSGESMMPRTSIPLIKEPSMDFNNFSLGLGWHSSNAAISSSTHQPAGKCRRVVDKPTKLCLWLDLNQAQSKAIKNAASLKQVKEILEGIVVNDFPEKQAVLINLFVINMAFARENNFTSAQISCLYSIVKLTHEHCISNSFGNTEEVFLYFTELVLGHSINKPPYNVELFSIQEVRSLSYHVINTYFRHLKLYKYIFTPKIILNMRLRYSGDPDFDEPEEVPADEGKLDEAGDTAASDVDDLAGKADREKAKVYVRNLITKYVRVKITELKEKIDFTLQTTESQVSKVLETLPQQKKKTKKKRKNLN